MHTKYAQQELEGSPYVASHREMFIRTTWAILLEVILGPFLFLLTITL